MLNRDDEPADGKLSQIQSSVLQLIRTLRYCISLIDRGELHLLTQREYLPTELDPKTAENVVSAITAHWTKYHDGNANTVAIFMK